MASMVIKYPGIGADITVEATNKGTLFIGGSKRLSQSLTPFFSQLATQRPPVGALDPGGDTPANSLIMRLQAHVEARGAKVKNLNMDKPPRMIV